jgi:hypothetical protein
VQVEGGRLPETAVIAFVSGGALLTGSLMSLELSSLSPWSEPLDEV